jgi:CRP-like cAMP-binding protein
MARSNSARIRVCVTRDEYSSRNLGSHGQSSFFLQSSTERAAVTLRLRPIPGYKPIAPPAAYIPTPLDALQDRPLFRGIPADEWATLISLAQQKCLARKEVIFQQGDPFQSGLIVTTGWTKISRVNRSGKEVILRIEGPGEIVAMRSGLEIVHSYTAQSLDACTTLIWSGRFRDLAERFPVLQFNSAKLLSERLRILEEQFEELATQRVPQRLARLLIRLEQQRGGCSHLPICFSCEELAQMAGTTLFTVSRLLTEWAERAIIEPNRKAVVIEDLPALIQVAEGSEGE